MTKSQASDLDPFLRICSAFWLCTPLFLPDLFVALLTFWPKMVHYPDEIEYSEKYQDDRYEYRHVILNRTAAKEVWKLTDSMKRLLGEDEWRGVGVQQSRGWVHYEFHRPEPHILLFRRELGTDPVTGKKPTAA